jgi:hypothetical protein
MGLPTWRMRFVDFTNGSDANNGLSEAAAFLTLKFAIETTGANKLVAGDWLLVRNNMSQTPTAAITATQNGTPAAPIRVSGVPRPAIASMRGTFVTGQQYFTLTFNPNATAYPQTERNLSLREIVAPDGRTYMISYVESTTKIWLEKAYVGAGVTDTAYTVMADPLWAELPAGQQSSWGADAHEVPYVFGAASTSTLNWQAQSNYQWMLFKYADTSAAGNGSVCTWSTGVGSLTSQVIIERTRIQGAGPALFDRVLINANGGTGATNFITTASTARMFKANRLIVFGNNSNSNSKVFSITNPDVMLDIQNSNFWIETTTTAVASIFMASGNTYPHVVMRNCNIKAGIPIYPATFTTLLGLYPIVKTLNSGVWSGFLPGIASIVQQVAGDVSFGLPSGYSDIGLLFVNGGASNGGVRNANYLQPDFPIAGQVSRRNCFELRLPSNATGYLFRLYYNTPSAALTGNDLWLSVFNESDGLYYKSGTVALTQRANKDDWANYITTASPIVLTATTRIVGQVHFAFYDASNKLAIAKMQISADNGSSWSNMIQTWVDGEITWILDPAVNIRDTRARRIEMIPKATAYPLEFQILSVSTGLPVDASALNTVTCQIAKDGGSLAAVTRAISKRTGLTGVYIVTLSTTETTALDIWAYPACSDAGTYISPINLQTDGGKLAGVADASTPPSRLVTGTALDSMSAAMAGLTVELKNGAGQTVYKATTDQDGDFSIGCLEGSYNLSAVRSGYTFNTIAVVVSGGNVTGQAITGTPYSITAPAVGAQTVYLYPEDPSLILDTAVTIYAEAILPNQKVSNAVLTGLRKAFTVVGGTHYECQLVKGGTFEVTGLTGSKKWLRGEIVVTADNTRDLTVYTEIEWY